MRVAFAFLLFTAALVGAACQTAPTPAGTQPGAAGPPRPMDTVTNPMNQPRIDHPGTMH